MFAELTPQNADTYCGVFYRAAGAADVVVRLCNLDLEMLENSVSAGFVLDDDFHNALVDSFLVGMEKMGITLEKDFWQKTPAQRTIQFEMQPNFLEGDPKQSDLGLIVVKRGLETVAVFHAEIDSEFLGDQPDSPLDF